MDTQLKNGESLKGDKSFYNIKDIRFDDIQGKLLSPYNYIPHVNLPSSKIIPNLVDKLNSASYVSKQSPPNTQYTSKLIKQPSQFFAKENTLFVVDYDDTLFPTHWIGSSDVQASYTMQREMILDHLKSLTDRIIGTLKRCMSLGNLIIVTNASFEWVYRSSEQHLPALLDFFIKNKIKIISTRDRYIGESIPQKNWKSTALMQLVQQFFSEQLYLKQGCSVISIGDGESERNACLEISKNFHHHGCITKIVKFITQPSCRSLIMQHEVVESNMIHLLVDPSPLYLETRVDVLNNNSVEIIQRRFA